MGKTVIIDADECIGCESCVELCSEVFAFNEEEEKAEVIMPAFVRRMGYLEGLEKY